RTGTNRNNNDSEWSNGKNGNLRGNKMACSRITNSHMGMGRYRKLDVYHRNDLRFIAGYGSGRSEKAGGLFFYSAYRINVPGNIFFYRCRYERCNDSDV